MESFGAQMELRAIQKRHRDETLRARAAGQPKQRPSYGYRYVRLTAVGKVDHVQIDPVAAEIIREVAERILTDGTDTITVSTEAARLTRAGVPSPADRRAAMYGREPSGQPWRSSALELILTSEAALGYLMHGGRPVIGRDGHPVKLAPELWDRATRDQLIAKTAPNRKVRRAPRGVHLLAGIAFCANCEQRLHVLSRSSAPCAWGCIARVRGIQSSQHCKPAPTMAMHDMDQQVTEWFLSEYGTGQVMRREFDPGTGYAGRIAELEADRKRLRDDRAAGLGFVHELRQRMFTTLSSVLMVSCSMFKRSGSTGSGALLPVGVSRC